MEYSMRMMLSIMLSAGLVLSLFAVLPSTNTALAQIGPYPVPQHDRVQKYTITGYAVEARWFIIDEEVYTEVELYLVDNAFRGDIDYPYPGSSLDVFITQYRLEEVCEAYRGEEECYYDFVPVLEFFGYAEPGNNEYRISKNLRAASIQGIQVEGYDFISGDEMTIILDGKWTSADGLIKVRHGFEQSTDAYKYVLKLSGTLRAADASLEISGDIDMNLQGDYDYASASIAKVKEGTMIRIQNH